MNRRCEMTAIIENPCERHCRPGKSRSRKGTAETIRGCNVTTKFILILLLVALRSTSLDPNPITYLAPLVESMRCCRLEQTSFREPNPERLWGCDMLIARDRIEDGDSYTTLMAKMFACMLINALQLSPLLGEKHWIGPINLRDWVPLPRDEISLSLAMLWSVDPSLIGHRGIARNRSPQITQNKSATDSRMSSTRWAKAVPAPI
jgi:hypothetical protein